MIRSTVYTSLAAAALVGWLVWTFQGARSDARVSEMKLELAESAARESEERRAADHRVFKISEAINATYTTALNSAIAETTVAQAAAARSDAANRRLRGQLQAAERSLATASATAVREYASTVGEVFGQCVQRYSELGRKADGHAIDAAACRAAWPVTPEGQ